MEPKEKTKAISRILIAILKQQAKNLIGDEVADELGDIFNESLGKNIDDWLNNKQDKITKAEKKAVELFVNTSEDRDLAQWMVSLPLANIPEIQKAIASLSESLGERELESVLFTHIQKNWSNIPNEKIDESVKHYLYCLRRALATIDEFRLDIMAKTLFTIQDSIEGLSENITGLALQKQSNNRNSYHPLELPPRALHFLGRSDEIVKLIGSIKPGEIVAVCGPGGIGKTAIVSEAIWKITDNGKSHPSEFPDGVIFHSFYNQSTLDLAFEHISSSFGVEPKPALELITQQALSNRCAILILDGCEVVDNLDKLLRIRGRCAVVISTRLRMTGVNQRIDLVELDENNSLQLLRILAEKRANDVEACKKICYFVGNLPLAIWLVGNYLNEREIDSSNFANQLDKKSLGALKLGDRQDQSIPWLLEQSFDCISDDGRKVMAVAGRLAFYYFDEEVIFNVLLGTLNLFEKQIQDIFGELIRYGLIRREGNFYYPYHALIHRYAREQLLEPDDILERLIMYYSASSSTFFVQGKEGAFLFRIRIPHILSLLEQLRDKQQWRDVMDLCKTFSSGLGLQGYWIINTLVAQYGKQAAQILGDVEDQILWATVEGDGAFKSGDIKNSTDLLMDALRLAQKNNDTTMIVSSHQSLGIVYREMGELGLSNDHLQQALSIARKLDDKRIQALILNDIGLNFHHQGNEDQAIKCYQEVLEIIKNAHDPQIEGNALSNMGEALRSKGQVEQAIQLFNRGLEIDRLLGDRAGEILDLDFLGSAYKDLGDIEKAVEYYKMSLALAKQMGDQHHISRVVEHLANIELKQGNIVASIAKYQEALEDSRRANNRWSEGVNLGNMGNAYMQQGEFETAEKYLTEALQIAKEVKNLKSQTGYLNNLGVIYYEKENYEEARRFFDDALEISRNIEDMKALNHALYHLGATLIQTSQLEHAREKFQKEKQVVQELDNRTGEAICLGVLADIADNSGNIENAIVGFKQALDLLQQTEDQFYTANILNHLGSLYNKKHEYSKAIQNYQRSLSIARKSGNVKILIVTLINLGNIYNETMNYDDALACLEEGLLIARSISDRRDELKIMSNLAGIYTTQHKLDLAFSVYQEVLAGAREEGNRILESIALGNLGIVHEKQGEANEAMKLFEQALSIARNAKDQKLEVKWLDNIGDIYMQSRDLHSAIDIYFQVFEISSQTNDEVNRAESLNKLGSAFFHLGDIESAGSCYFSALEIAEELDLRNLVGILRGNIGTLYLRLQHKDDKILQEAETNLEQALVIAQEAKDFYNQGVWLNNLGTVYLNRNNRAKAHEYYQRALAVLETSLFKNDPLIQSILQNLEK